MVNLSFVLQIILAVLFLTVSLQKIFGNQQQVDIFKSLNLPQWFRVVTGWVEFIGVAGLIIGLWFQWAAILAGLWLGITLLVGFVTHIRVRDPISKTSPSFIIAVLSITITITNLPGLQNVFS